MPTLPLSKSGKRVFLPLLAMLAMTGLHAQGDNMHDLLASMQERSAEAVLLAKGIHDPDRMDLWKGIADVPAERVATLSADILRLLQETKDLTARFEVAARPHFTAQEWEVITSDLIVVKRETEQALGSLPAGTGRHVSQASGPANCSRHDNEQMRLALMALWDVHASTRLISNSIGSFAAQGENK